ncbi:MAG TPA: SLBB domain-containing protein [Fibrobacteria bacterium]|nr:SLBB domain-containing protein [Fibrobacteria bacterium]
MPSVARFWPAFFCFFLVSALSVQAQRPTPSPAERQQIREFIASGAPITPDMLAMARSRFPALKNYSDDDIMNMVAEERRSASGGQGTELSAQPSASNQSVSGQFPASQIPGSQTPTNTSAIGTTAMSQFAASQSGQVATPTYYYGQPSQGFAGSLSSKAPGDERFPAELKRFGWDFFLNADLPTQASASPALSDYILSPGDQLVINTWGRESRTLSPVIDNEGMLYYPPMDPARIAGMRFSAAQKFLVSEIEKIHGVSASVSLGRLRDIRVMVLGEATRPGSFAVPAGSTVTAALFRSGGITEIGSLRAIEVRRSGKVAATLDLYEMLLKGKSAGDIQLLPGDVIFIPLAGPQVAVYGMVKRPAIYEVKGGMKALEAVDLAGGLEANAFKGRLLLDRVQGNKRNIVLDVDMEKPDAKSNVRLESGDILRVDKVLDQIEDAVWLKGNVNRAGRYQYKRGMTVRDLIPSLQDLAPETFFEYAHIQRVAPDDGRRVLLNFPLGDVFSKGLRVPLEPRDTVIVYGRYDLVTRPTVTISGAVRARGTIVYSEGMRVSDLIVLGGGFAQEAYLSEAQILRRVEDATADSLYVKVIKVNMKAVMEDPSSSENLPLEPFDALVVFSSENFVPRRTVGLYGAVRNEGAGYDLAEGMGIPELLKLAGGMTKNSYRLGVEVARRTIVGDSVLTRKIMKLNLKAILDGSETFRLEDGDVVYVREVINSRAFSSVAMTGEFNFPGSYEITPGERLSSVLRRAGGFSNQAYLRGAVFLRKRVREQQILHAEEIGRRVESQMQARLMQTTQEKERAGLTVALERSGQLVDQIKRAPNLGRVVIRVDSKMKFAGTEWDLELENGDSLWVGPRVGTVSVLGEVSSPTTVIYTRKTNQVGELLARAGGVAMYGDYKATFYVGPDGTVTTPHTVPWYSSFKCMKVEPGGTIIVPMKPPAKDYLEIWAQSSQILYNLAVSVGVAATLF